MRYNFKDSHKKASAEASAKVYKNKKGIPRRQDIIESLGIAEEKEPILAQDLIAQGVCTGTVIKENSKEKRFCSPDCPVHPIPSSVKHSAIEHNFTKAKYGTGKSFSTD